MKNLTLAFLLLNSFLAFSQYSYERGEIFYRNGSSEKGYIKVKYSEIKFKRKITDKKPEELTYKKVKKIILNEDGEDFEYQYKIIKGKKKGKFKLLKVVLLGEVSLYKLEHETSVSAGKMNHPISTGITYKGANFYIGKNTNSLVNFVGANSIAIGRKSIRKGLITYFKDCKKLVNKLKNKEFKNRDIVKVVTFYNQKCTLRQH